MSALEDFRATFADGYTVSDVALHLTCSEAEAFAALYREAGDDAIADEWLIAHASQDDSGDMVHTLTDGSIAPREVG